MAGNHLQGKADAGKFAAGRDFVQRTGRIAFVGGNLKLYLLQTVRSGGRRQQDDVETRAFHGEMLHMSGRFLAQPARRLMAHGGKNMGGFLIFGKVAGNGLRQRFQIGSGLQALQAFVDFSQLLRQGFRLDAVFPRHPHQLTHALFLRRQFVGIDVAAACNVAHIGTDFAQFGFNARQHIQAFGKARLNVLQIGQ